MELEKVSIEYLDHLKKIKRYSANTIIAYCADLKDFINYCQVSGKFDLISVTDKIILSYMMELNESGLDMKSISRKLSAIKGLFKYSYINDYLEMNPAAVMINPKIKRRLPETADEESILKVFSLADEKGKDSLLVKIIFELLYGCALRVSELCNLNRGDIDLRKELLKVKGKGRKERIIPIGSKSMEVLKEYLKENNYSDSRSPLISKEGRRIYPRFVQRIVQKYLSAAADIEKNSPHILRHSAATHMLDNGADLNAVKEILGHESLSTTQIYTHVSVERLKKAYKKAHPKS